MQEKLALGRRAWRRAHSSGLLLGVGILLSFPALAQHHELERVQPATLSLEVGAALLMTGGVLLLPTPTSCRWCDPPGIDEALALPAQPQNRRTNALVSHGLSMIALPTLALSTVGIPPLLSRDADVHGIENLAIVSEAMLFDVVVTVITKAIAARQRPAFHYARHATGEYEDYPSQANVSFFSGDSSVAFALAGSMSTVSFMRGYASAPYVAVASGLLAATTAVLRVRADVHWPTDVMTGAIVGAGIGIAVPLLLHPRVSEPAVSPLDPVTEQPLSMSPAMMHFGGRF